jgi:hypothetical protein
MAMSSKFKAGVQNTVYTTGVGEQSLIDVSDFRLQRLISGVEDAIAHKKAFLDNHKFPPAGVRYLVTQMDELSRLETRLQDLNMEKARRGA